MHFVAINKKKATIILYTVISCDKFCFYMYPVNFNCHEQSCDQSFAIKCHVVNYLRWDDGTPDLTLSIVPWRRNLSTHWRVPIIKYYAISISFFTLAYNIRAWTSRRRITAFSLWRRHDEPVKSFSGFCTDEFNIIIIMRR